MSHEMEPLYVSHPLPPSTSVFCFYFCPKDSEGRSVNSSTNTAVCASSPGLCSVQTPCDVMRSPEASPATCFSAAGVRAWGNRVYIIVVSKGRPLRDTGGGQKGWQAPAEPALQLFYIFAFPAKIYEIWVPDMMARGTPG